MNEIKNITLGEFIVYTGIILGIIVAYFKVKIRNKKHIKS